VSQATYAALFAVIGVTYGNPGGGNFSLPDLRGRIPVGLGTHASVDVLGDSDAATLADRSPSHHHLYNAPAGAVPMAGGATANLNSSASTKTSGNQNLQDSPAFLTVQMIIKI